MTEWLVEPTPEGEVGQGGGEVVDRLIKLVAEGEAGESAGEEGVVEGGRTGGM